MFSKLKSSTSKNNINLDQSLGSIKLLNQANLKDGFETEAKSI